MCEVIMSDVITQEDELIDGDNQCKNQLESSEIPGYATWINSIESNRQKKVCKMDQFLDINLFSQVNNHDIQSN